MRLGRQLLERLLGWWLREHPGHPGLLGGRGWVADPSSPAVIGLTLLGCVPHPVDVEILGAVVGPSTSDLQAWDGIGHISPEDRAAAIARAGEIDPTAGQATAAFLAFLDATSAPDPAGDASSGGQRVMLAENPDTFTARWSGATLRGLVLKENPVVSVRLEDQDTAFDAPDPIATVTIDAATLRRALRSGEPWAVDTAEVTNGQLLWVTLAVRRSE